MESQSSGLAASREQTVGAADRVTVYSWKALAGSTIGYSMDGFDLMIVSFMLTAISADLALTSTQAGSLITWTLMGAVAGGLIFGSISDHFGRIRVLTWTILIFAVFTGLCGLARGYWDLVAYRTFAGLGLGGEFGIGMALAAEAWPASKRARVSCYVAIGWQAGVLLAAFVTPVLLPVVGWRGMFLLGLLPAVVAFIVRRAPIFSIPNPVRGRSLWSPLRCSGLSGLCGRLIMCFQNQTPADRCPDMRRSLPGEPPALPISSRGTRGP